MPKPKADPTPEDDLTLDPDDEGSDLETGDPSTGSGQAADLPKRKPRKPAASESERLKAAEQRNRELAERLDAAEKQTAAQQARLDRKEIEEKLAAMRLGAGRDLALTPAARALFADLAMASDAEELLFASAQAKDGKADQTARDRVLVLAASAADLTYPLGVKGFVAGEEEPTSEKFEGAIRKRMADSGGKLDYEGALKAVMEEEPELASAYERDQRKRREQARNQ